VVGAGTIAVQVRSPTASYFLLVFVLHVTCTLVPGGVFFHFSVDGALRFFRFVERALDA
jgi:hypothetical protein